MIREFIEYRKMLRLGNPEMLRWRGRSDALAILLGIVLPALSLWHHQDLKYEHQSVGYERAFITLLWTQMGVFLGWIALRPYFLTDQLAMSQCLFLGCATSFLIGYLLLPLSLSWITATLVISLLVIVLLGMVWMDLGAAREELRSASRRTRILGAMSVILFLGSGGSAWNAYKASWQAPDFSEIQQAGDPLVLAIYAFREKHGIWPQYLVDAVAEGQANQIPGNWKYTEGDTLSKSVHWKGIPLDQEAEVVYSFRPGGERWEIRQRDRVTALNSRPTKAPVPLVRTRGHEPLVLAEIHRRMQREPTEIRHLQERTSFLVELGRVQDAVEDVAIGEQMFPRHWWPALVAADLAHRLGTPRRGKLVEWVKLQSDFTSAWYLFQYDADKGNVSVALDDIRAVIRFPFKHSQDDPYIPSWYFFKMAIYAYLHGAFELAIEVCDRSMGVENSLRFLRIASVLALGEVAKARIDLQAAGILEGAAPLWIGSVEGLTHAVESSDRTFRLIPNETYCMKLYSSPR